MKKALCILISVFLAVQSIAGGLSVGAIESGPPALENSDEYIPDASDLEQIEQIQPEEPGTGTNGIVSPPNAAIAYRRNSNAAWITASGAVEATNIDCIRLQTTNTAYYLSYRTRNIGGPGGFYAAVSSNDSSASAYAGSSGKAIELLGIRVLSSSNPGSSIDEGIVVMYRTKTANGWLPWVSNAKPEWMQSVQSKYNLGGSLDTGASYAGQTGVAITGFEIRIYEEDRLDASPSFSGGETSASTSYVPSGGSAWINFSKKVEVGTMDKLKIHTSDTDYYLSYQVKSNNSDGFSNAVASNNPALFAGTAGAPIQWLRIRAYSSAGEKLVSGVIVMYRAKISTGWLPWVSNADPEYMQSVKSRYNLDGTLDTTSSYAGKSGYNMTGLEIRIFKGTVPEYRINTLAGKESALTMLYGKRENGVQSYIPFTKDTVLQNPYTVVKLQTPSSASYYLRYRVYGAGAGFYSYVNSNVDDYAGVFGRQIQAIGIQVYSTGGAKITKGIVVMYRAKTSAGWLPWVSNADPEWMQSVRLKYGLDGTLDTKSGYAGVIGNNIQQIEIRVFEENAVQTSCGAVNQTLVSAPFIRQTREYTNACESVSTVMAIQKAGFGITVKTFMDLLDTSPNRHNFDPNVYYGGTPGTSDGMGCYAPVVMKALNKALTGKKLQGNNLTGTSLPSLCAQYIDHGIPVILWGTMGMKKAYTVQYSEGLTWIAPEHCLLLVGYDSTCYIFHDPLVGANTHYYKADVEAAYTAFGKQAIVILQTSTSSQPSGRTDTNPSGAPPAVAKEYQKPNTAPESKSADPIDLSTGSHVIENQLIRLFEGNQTALIASYDSSKLVSGSMGVGWTHNFEKRLEETANGILVYDSPSVYSTYVRSGDEYVCTTIGKEHFVLTQQPDNGYLLNCNQNEKMFFNANGQLTAIENKQGLVTTLVYAEDSVVINDAIRGSITLHFTNGLITSMTDGIRTVELTYSDGYLIEIKDVNGESLYYTYNAAGKIETGSDDHNTLYFVDTYGTDGRIASQQDGTGNANAVTYFYYDETAEGLSVTVFNRNGDESYRLFNAYGLLTQYTDEEGNITEYEYDANRNLISITDALDHSENTLYNEYNLPVLHSDKNGNITSFAYDAAHNLITTLYGANGDINGDGQVNVSDLVRMKKYFADSTTSVAAAALDLNEDLHADAVDLIYLRQYLAGARQIAVKQETYCYDSHNRLTSMTDLNGVSTSLSYNENGQIIRRKTGDRIETYQYSEGRLTDYTDAGGNASHYLYNQLGLIAEKQKTVTSLQYEPIATNEVPTISFGFLIIDDNEEWEEEQVATTYTTRYTYDNKGNVLSVTDPAGHTVIRTYDANNLLLSETDANGNTTHYSYNGNMKPVSVTKSDGSVTEYTYDLEDRLVAEQDGRGNRSYRMYDRSGALICTTDADQNNTVYENDAVGNVTAVYGQNGGVTRYTYDAMGNVLSVTDANGNTTQNTYDRFNRLIQTVNPAGGVTCYSYSLTGKLLSQTDPMGNITHYTYDSFGNMLSMTDPRGNTTSYTYDSHNNLLSVTDPLGNRTVHTYDEENRLLTTKKPNGAQTSYQYDGAGNLLSVRDPLGHTVTYSYDANGNALTKTDAKGNLQTTTVYDSMNRALTVTDAASGTVQKTYDQNGNLISVTDSLQNIQRNVVDPLNRPIAVYDRQNSGTNVTYNAAGQILSISPANGGELTCSYDLCGNLVSKTTPSGGLVSYTYNAQNLKATETNARNQQKTYLYDLAGRITGYTSPEGTASFTYDASGNILTATDQNGTVTRTYDALNRVASVTDVNGQTIQYEYNNAGLLSRMIYPDGTAVNYLYDLAGNLSRVTDWANRVTTYTYDENNRITEVRKPDGSVTQTVYDAAQRVIHTAETVNNSVITGYEYTYDALGRILSETDLAKNIQMVYTYDGLSRVVSRTVIRLSDNSQTTETYAYDEGGNLLTAGNTAFGYDSNNRLTAYNNQSVSYDADGNMTAANLAGTVISLAYDSANRLTGAGANSYTYDVNGTRVRNLCGQSVTTYAVDTVSELSRLLAKTTDGITTKYVYGNGLIGEESNGAFKTYHFDYRGSTIAVTDSSGTATDTFAYDSYGNLLSRTGTSEVIFLYNGQYGVVTDSNGFLYMRARYYSPELRRFVSADPADGDIHNSPTLNRYAYANGNPISNIDPFGLTAERESKGRISYRGTEYPIFVPFSFNSSIDTTWQDVLLITDNIYNFNFFDLAKDFEAEDYEITANLPLNGALGFFTGIIRSANQNLNVTSITIKLQKSNLSTRAILTISSSETQKIYGQHAGSIPISGYQNHTPLKNLYVSNYVKQYYEQYTGEKLSNGVYDYEITIDSRHKNNGNISYIWLSSDNKIMETPIIYSDDSISLGKRSGLFNTHYDKILNLPLSNKPYETSSEFSDLISALLAKNALSLY